MATLILIHGAFHKPNCWQKILPTLDQAEVPYVLVDRFVPSTDTRQGAVSWDPERDGRQVEQIIEDSKIEGPIVLVGHSRGGDAITYGGNHPQVVRLVYLAAHVPGIDTPEGMPKTNPLVYKSCIDNGDGTWNCDYDIARGVYYSDCTFANDDDVKDLLRPQCKPSRDEVNLSVAYRSKETTYIVCLNDQTTFSEAQRFWAEELQKITGGDTIELSTGHSPFLSKPDLLAEKLIAIAKACQTKEATA